MFETDNLNNRNVIEQVEHVCLSIHRGMAKRTAAER